MKTKYAEYKKLDLTQIAKEVQGWWEQNEVFEKSVENRNGAAPYVFYEGPPSANGIPGIHHVMARAIKDIFCRYKTLKGYQVKRKAGWDTHGLPIEIGVEKSLGITKDDIGKSISIADYNKACRKDVMKYKDLWDDITKKMGYWVDLSDPYITFENKYIETVWYLLSKLYEKGLLYKGYTIQPYSPAAGTGLSSHELNLPGCYKNVKDNTVVAQFKVIRNDKSDFLFKDTDSEVFFLAWTTTPWTLPSNTALAVGEDIDYILVSSYNIYTDRKSYYVLAKNLFEQYFASWKYLTSIAIVKGLSATLNYTIVNQKYMKTSDLSVLNQDEITELKNAIVNDLKIHIPLGLEIKCFKGSELKDIRYEQLLQYGQQPIDGDAFMVVCGDFVTTEDGTGIVHIAPSFGADDFKVARLNGLGSLTMVDKQGRFVDEMGEFAKRYVKNEYDPKFKAGENNSDNVDIDIIVKLKKENKAFKTEKYEHSYPHCWRTDKPILYYPLDSWFIKTTAYKERMLELNKTINWKPESTGTGRFGNWLENLVDWNLSRSRYWGVPIPIWTTEDREEQLCIGSVEQLKKEIERSVKAGFMKTDPLTAFKPNDFTTENYNTFDIHRPYVDEIVLVSPTGKKMMRETDLIDVWFDSGAMPYAQFHYPFENKELFEKSYPADFIAEGVDQTRGWFFTLHAIAVMLFDSVSYKTVVSNGLVLDKAGNKMSKRLGNAVNPFETIEKYGPDATRWYMITNAQPWDNLKFDSDGIGEVQRKFFGTLYNTYSFFSLYANIDGFSFAEKEIDMQKRPEIDRWIISELNSLIRNVDEYYADYEPTKAGRAIQYFLDEHLSNWYVRLCRRRFWKGEYTEDKIAAYQTLYKCIETIAFLSSPIAPFYMDRLYKDLNSVTGKNQAISIHLADFPKADENLIDKELEERMQIAQQVSSMVLALRKKVNIRVRQPLGKISIPVFDEHLKTQIEAVKNLILSEVNVKSLEYIQDSASILVKKIKPNFKTLGPKYSKLMKQIAAGVAAMKQEDINKFESEGRYHMSIEGNEVILELSDVEILSEDIPGLLVSNNGSLTVALDINLTEQLKEEGIARELVNRIQNLRKDSDYEVTDKIMLMVEKHHDILSAIKNNYDYICSETLATSLEISDRIDHDTKVSVELTDEIQTNIFITKAKS
jgi:isoleucyl-tRNA synthetase